MSKKTILIVDDAPFVPLTLSKIIQLKGYSTETALSGSEALEKFKAGNIACVLTDIKMYGMNGIELLRALKKIQPDIPVILMTAYSRDDLVLEGMKAGAHSSMIKPLDIDNLLATIRGILE